MSQPSVKDDSRVVDQRSKESAFLTNIIACGDHLPISEPHQEVIDAAQGSAEVQQLHTALTHTLHLPR